jgi:hypothetical protein
MYVWTAKRRYITILGKKIEKSFKNYTLPSLRKLNEIKFSTGIPQGRLFFY